ncbi:MAG: AAA family ATPase [Thermoguttaceae bacterium]|nr:AAA family ATPase [Thermoguttaceae bacterium]MDW8079173.1 AAA family ATPase [Thermoguttaceae bacterium]
MKLKQLAIKQFGLWRNVSLGPFQPGLQLVFGPNEAGKTTLCRFIEEVLFGPTEKTESYLGYKSTGEKLHTSASSLCGGTIDAVHQGETVRFWRFFGPTGERGLDAHTPSKKEGLELNSVDELLPAGVPREVLRPVFFFDLRELQQLALLGRKEVAELIFTASASLIGVPFSELLRQVDRRLAAFVDEHGPGLLTELGEKLRGWDEQSRLLCAERHQAEAITKKIRLLERQRQLVDEELARVKEELLRLELALKLCPLWQQKEQLARQLAEAGTIPAGTTEAASEIHRWQCHLARLKERGIKLKEQIRNLQEKRQALGLVPGFTELRQQVRALAARQKHLGQLEAQVQQAAEKVVTLRTKWDELASGLPPQIAKTLAQFGELRPKDYRRLRIQAKKLVDQSALVAEYREQIAQGEAAYSRAYQSFVEQLGTVAPEELPQKIEQLAQKVERLRQQEVRRNRRRELEELERLLAAEYEALRCQEPVPRPIRLVLQAVLWTSALAVVVSAIGPLGILSSWGWPLLGAGGMGLSSTILVRYFLESAHLRKLATCLEQLEQIRQCLGREQSPARLVAVDQSAQPPPPSSPRGDEPSGESVPDNQGAAARGLAEMLAEAETELARLKRLAPQQAFLNQQAVALRELKEKAGSAANTLGEIDQGWRELTGKLGLPSTLDPQEYLDAFGRLIKLRRLEPLIRKAELSRRRWERRKQRVDKKLARLEEALGGTTTHLERPSPTLAERVTRLRQLCGQIEKSQKAAKRLGDKIARVRRQLRLVRTHQARCQKRIGRIVRSLGLRSAEEVYQFAQKAAQLEALTQEAQRLQREIEEHIQAADKPEVAELLSSLDQTSLEEKAASLRKFVDELISRSHQLSQELADCEAHRSRLSSAEKWWQVQAERYYHGRRLRQVFEEAVTWMAIRQALLAARNQFERVYQPEALQIASQLLAGFTGGRYRRIWCQMDGQQLLVEDDSGQSWIIEQLSQGTCDQIYICVRLALVSLFVRRGIELPVILDDVLVNFDAPRLARAARTLTTWAGRRLQVILLTCHPHVLRAFARLKVPVFFLTKPQEPQAESDGAIRWIMPRQIKIRRKRKPSPSAETLTGQSADNFAPLSDQEVPSRASATADLLEHNLGEVPAKDPATDTAQPGADATDPVKVNECHLGRGPETKPAVEEADLASESQSAGISSHRHSDSLSQVKALSLRVFRGEVTPSTKGLAAHPKNKRANWIADGSAPPTDGENTSSEKTPAIGKRQDAGCEAILPPNHLGLDRLNKRMDKTKGQPRIDKSPQATDQPGPPTEGKPTTGREPARKLPASQGATPAAENTGTGDLSGSPNQLTDESAIQKTEGAIDQDTLASPESIQPPASRRIRPRVEYWGHHQGSFDAHGRPLGRAPID